MTRQGVSMDIFWNHTIGQEPLLLDFLLTGCMFVCQDAAPRTSKLNYVRSLMLGFKTLFRIKKLSVYTR